MNFFFPDFNALCMAENCSHNMHNLIPIRGAQVRNSLSWSTYIDDAIELFANDTDLMFASHHWPRWGNDDVRGFLARQRDLYRWIHDQTLRLANHGHVATEIADGELRAPRSGRVQYRVVQPGEVVGGGGKVVSLVDVGDVYMTFFLPEMAAGRVALGSEVRIVLDAAQAFVIPARVSYVASVAQFTPKTVETASEREKLMFRIKARIDPELLSKHLQQVKTGVPGMAYLRLDPDAEWPAHLAIKVPQ